MTLEPGIRISDKETKNECVSGLPLRGEKARGERASTGVSGTRAASWSSEEPQDTCLTAGFCPRLQAQSASSPKWLTL